MAIDPKTGLPVPDTQAQVAPTAQPGVSSAVTSAPTTAPAPTVSVNAPTETANLGWQKPVKNEITGGYETVNPQIPVNTGIYSPEEKAEAVKNLGYTLKKGSENVDFATIQDAFYRKDDNTIGVKEEMLSPYFEKVPQAPKEPEGTGVVPPSVTQWVDGKPLASNDEVNRKQLDDILSSNNLDEEQKKWWMDNIFNTPEARADFFKKTDAERKEMFESVAYAQKTTRDASLKADYMKKQQDYRIEQQKAEFAVQKAKMEAQMDADANNMSIAQGVSGRIQSQNMANAVKQQLNLNQKVYDEMVATQDRYLSILAEEFKYENTRASNEYNDAMAKVKQDLLSKINGLIATGVMNTKSGLLQAQSFVDGATQAGNMAMQQYSYNLAVGAERAKVLAEQVKARNAYSDEITNQMNDGFLYTAGGTRMEDAQGNPIKAPTDVNGTPMFKEPQKADDGTYFQAYRQPDGTIKTVTLGGIGQQTAGDEAINAYAKLIANKTIGINDLKGLSQATRNQIIQAAGAFAQQTGGKGEWKVVGQHVETDANGNMHVVSDYGRVDEYGNVTQIRPGSRQTSDSYKVVEPQGTDMFQTPVGTTFAKNERGYWCGQFVNDSIGKRVFGDSLQSKLDKINSEEPVIGGAIILDMPGKYKANGHVGIVTGYDPQTGEITMKSSNFTKEGTVTEDKIKMNDPRLQGFYDPTKDYKADIDTKNTPAYVDYMENGKTPAKLGGANLDAWKEQAAKGYVAAKRNEYARSGFEIEDPDAFISTDSKVKQDIAKQIPRIQAFIDKMDNLKRLVREHGSEHPWTEAGKEMAAIAKDAQLTAKEIYNLGVLNWPDLSLMEAIIANPTSAGSQLTSGFQDLEKQVENGKQAVISNIISSGKALGLKYVPKESVNTEAQTNTGGWTLSTGQTVGSLYKQ